jgi:hypothetical protein
MVKSKEKVRIVAGVQDIPNGLFSQMTDLDDKCQEQTCKKSRIRTNSTIATFLQGRTTARDSIMDGIIRISSPENYVTFIFMCQ